MDQAPHNKSFDHHFRKPQLLRTLAERPAVVSHRLLQRGQLPARRATSNMRIVVTASQELVAMRGARLNGHTSPRMARLLGFMPSAIGHLQGSCAAHSREILVTVSRVLTSNQGLGLNRVEITRMAYGRDVWLAAGQA